MNVKGTERTKREYFTLKQVASKLTRQALHILARAVRKIL